MLSVQLLSSVKNDLDRQFNDSFAVRLLNFISIGSFQCLLTPYCRLRLSLIRPKVELIEGALRSKRNTSLFE